MFDAIASHPNALELYKKNFFFEKDQTTHHQEEEDFQFCVSGCSPIAVYVVIVIVVVDVGGRF